MVANQQQLIQAFELLEGKVNITSGTFKVHTLIHANEDSSITVHFPGGDAVITVSSGMDFALNDTEITVNSGHIHYS